MLHGMLVNIVDEVATQKVCATRSMVCPLVMKQDTKAMGEERPVPTAERWATRLTYVTESTDTRRDISPTMEEPQLTTW